MFTPNGFALEQACFNDVNMFARLNHVVYSVIVATYFTMENVVNQQLFTSGTGTCFNELLSPS